MDHTAPLFSINLELIIQIMKDKSNLTLLEKIITGVTSLTVIIGAFLSIAHHPIGTLLFWIGMGSSAIVDIYIFVIKKKSLF